MFGRIEWIDQIELVGEMDLIGQIDQMGLLKTPRKGKEDVD